PSSGCRAVTLTWSRSRPSSRTGFATAPCAIRRETWSASRSGAEVAKSPAELIDARIAELGDWRGDLLARIRKLIKQADPEVVEEWKWRGVPTRYHDGMICTGETYKASVKVTFAKGASL